MAFLRLPSYVQAAQFSDFHIFYYYFLQIKSYKDDVNTTILRIYSTCIFLLDFFFFSSVEIQSQLQELERERPNTASSCPQLLQHILRRCVGCFLTEQSLVEDKLV